MLQVPLRSSTLAIEIYRRIDAGQAWIDRVMADRERAVGAPETAKAERVTDRTGHNMFHKQGDYWAISFDGVEFNLKDAKGLQYVARLLRCPGEQVSAIDLAAPASGETSGSQRTGRSRRRGRSPGCQGESGLQAPARRTARGNRTLATNERYRRDRNGRGRV